MQLNQAYLLLNRIRKLSLLSLVVSLTLFWGGSVHAQRYPNTNETKANLEMLGYQNEWQPMQKGEKLVIDNGEIWVNNKDTFALLAVIDDDEETMRSSIIDNLAICATLGVAVSGQSSVHSFKTFGSLMGNALNHPKQKIVDDSLAFLFHLMVTDGAQESTMLRCGVQANNANS
ncbi:hypothetical protein EH171_13105 [Enterovibrio baiacu]|nr:hypothetical protein [Enterovibrio baiacu]